MNYLLRKGSKELETDSEKIVKRAVKKGYVLEDKTNSATDGMVSDAKAKKNRNRMHHNSGRALPERMSKKKKEINHENSRKNY